MADQNTKPKTISFAGRNIDQNEFTRRARQKADEWARYQGLKGDEINDFNESLNDILAGISDGRYTVTESGALSGKGTSTANTYNTRTGARVEDSNGGNSRRRRGFDPNANVMGYLNGIAGAMSSGGYSRSSSNSSPRGTTMQQYLSDAIFGEGNSFSPEQVVRWADAYDAVGNDGKRGISGRRQWIADTLNEYRTKYNNGEFGEVSDEERTKTNELIDSIISNNNPDIDKDWELSKNAPWLSHLLFRDAKYYSDDAERQADKTKAEEDATKKALEAYVNGVEGATNPYEPGTEGYKLAEKTRQDKELANFDKDFRTHQWDYADAGKSFRTQVHESLPQDLFSNWNINNVREYLAGAEGLETNEYGQDVNTGGFGSGMYGMGKGVLAGAGAGAAAGAGIGAFAGGVGAAPGAVIGGIIGGVGGLIQGGTRFAHGNEFGHEDYTGWGKGDTSLRTSGLINYFDALPNDFRPDDTTKNTGGFDARSNKAILGKAAADYARAIIANSGDQFRLSDGSYLLPQFIDWGTGKAYRFNMNGNKAVITTDNIGAIINGLTPGSPLYNTLLNEWRSYNKKPTFKEGGVLYAAKGDTLSPGEIEILRKASASTQTATPSQPTYTPMYADNTLARQEQKAAEDQQRYMQAQQMGVAKEERQNKGKETLGSGLTAIDFARMGAITADLASAVAAFVPGIGTAPAAALGIGSTAATLGADIADKSVSNGDVIKGLGVNLLIDAASLIPGLGTGTVAGKLGKNLLKLAPKLIPIFMTMQTGPEAIKTTEKILQGRFKDITKEELRNLNYCISAVSGTARMGGMAAEKYVRNPIPKGAKVKTYKYTKANGETGTLYGEQATKVANAVNEAGKKGGNEEALKALTSATEEGAKFANGENFETGVLGRFKSKPAEVVSGYDTQSEAYINYLNKALSKDEALRTRMVNKGGIPKYIAEHFATNFEMAHGAPTWIANPFAGNGVTRRMLGADRHFVFGNDGAYKANLEAQKGIAEKAFIDKIKTGTEAGKDLVEPVTTRESAAVKRAQEAQAASDQYFKTEREALNKAIQEKSSAESAHKTAVNNYNKATDDARKAGTSFSKLGKGVTKRRAEIATGEAELSKYDALVKERDALQTKLNDIKGKTKDKVDERTAVKAELDAKNTEIKDLESSIKTRTQQASADAYRKALASLKGNEATYTRIKALKDAIDAAAGNVTTTSKAYQTARANFLGRKGTPEGQRLRREAIQAKREVSKPAGNVSDYLASSGITIEGATPAIKTVREQNFENFIQFLKDNKQGDAQIREILADKTVMDKARDLFKFYRGGILKANDGTKVPDKKDKTPEVTNNKPSAISGWSGTLGTTGTTTKATTSTQSTGKSEEGLINPQQFEPKPGWIGYGINPTDAAITSLENAKYGLTQGINTGIYNVYAGFRGFHETPLLKHYRQWSSKPLEDQMAKNTAEYRRLGANSAAGTSDQGQAFAWQLAATDKAMAANAPLAIQANEQIKTTVDQQNAVGNENYANMHAVGERNRQGDVALSNARLKAYADYLHKMGTTASQNIMSRQYGMGKAGIINDQRMAQAAAANDPTVSQAKNAYQELLTRKATNPGSWTEADDSALQVAAQNYKFANSNFMNRWNATHIPTTGSPYAGYGTTFGGPEYFDFANFNTGYSFAKGGKMEAAEREKTRKEYEKIYHDSMKLMVQESNKKLRSSAYAFYRKLFMHKK